MTDRYKTALRSAGRSGEEIERLLARWMVTKHVYVAPSDAEARAQAEGPERWYLDSFARSFKADHLPNLHPSIYEQARTTQSRLTSIDFERHWADNTLIGSPETVAAKVAALNDAGVAELACWMNFGGLTPDQARR